MKLKKYKTVEIEAIEEIKSDETVYDIQVKDDHSYAVSSNIAVHN